MNKKIFLGSFIIIFLIISVFVLSSYVKGNRLEAKNQKEIETLRESPAAEYCKNNGGTLEIIDNEYIYGMCNFKDGSACEILEYFRGECLSASEENENDTSYCSNGSTCEDEENDNEEPEDLSSWIEDINNIENINGEIDGETLESDDLDEFDIDSLYDYYENEFSNTGNRNREQPMENLEGGKNMENQLSSKCNKVGGEILGEKCYLSNGIEITF